MEDWEPEYDRPQEAPELGPAAPAHRDLRCVRCRQAIRAGEPARLAATHGIWYQHVRCPVLVLPRRRVRAVAREVP